MSSRFFIPPDQITANRFVLLGTEARHATVVLRKKAGDEIHLFDGQDLSYQGRIDLISADRVEGTIVSEQKAKETAGAELILCQALIKGPKWDWLIEKASEIGVTRLVPLTTARTVVKPAKGHAPERWGRIALAAAKQSGRASVMKIAAPIAFAEAFAAMPQDTLLLMPWEKETAHTIRQVMSTDPGHNHSGMTVALFIGPEGGWESKEVELAERHGAVPVKLGPTLLRSETAGLVAAALVLSELGVYA